jgi:protein involved in temperature-dependent protein secretion
MIVMEKFTLSFGYCNDCSCGQLEVFDGKSDSGTRLGSWCATPVPEVISTGRYVYVKFSARSYSTYQKFKAYYKSIRNQTGN